MGRRKKVVTDSNLETENLVSKKNTKSKSSTTGPNIKNNSDKNIENENKSIKNNNVEEVPIKKKRGRKPKIKTESESNTTNVVKRKRRGRHPLNKFNSNTNTIEDISKINQELNTNRIIKLPIDCIELDKEFNLENYWTYNPIMKEPVAYDNDNNNYYNLEVLDSNNNTNTNNQQQLDNNNNLNKINNNSNKINNNLSINNENIFNMNTSNNIHSKNIHSNNVQNNSNFTNNNFINSNLCDNNLTNKNLTNNNLADNNLINNNLTNINLTTSNFTNNNLTNINNLHNINMNNNNINKLNKSHTLNNKSNDLQNKNINKLTNKNENTNTNFDNKSNNTMYQDKINELLEDLDDTNKNKNLSQIEILLNKKYNQIKKIPLYNFKHEKWPTKSSCPCFWCNHTFDNVPWGIPNKYENNSFVLFGNFCSPNCALSYLIVRENNINLFEKISLLNLLYYYVYNNDSIIVPAPDKICIDTYGGPFTISQYRYLTSNNNKNYNIVFPSCNVVNPIFEETKKSVNQNNYYIPIDKNRINKIQTELKIKRSKPINNIKNTLDNCMTIIYN